MRDTVLGLSLIHARFDAVSIVKGHVQHSWTCPRPVESIEDLQVAVESAVSETRFVGQCVSLLLEDRRLAHLYVHLPPMSEKDLRAVLHRTAEQEKMFEEPAVWRYRLGCPARGKLNVLLDIWPESLVGQFVDVCERLGLIPIRMVPLSTVFVDQIQTLPIEPDEVTLLVAATAGKVAFIVGKGDGTPLFDRFLNPAGQPEQEAERIGREITRSVLYADQHFDLRVEQIWMMGELPEISMEMVQQFVDLPILPSPIVPDARYWIWVSATAPSDHPGNFVPREVQTAPRRRALVSTAWGLTGAFAGAALAVTAMLGAIHLRAEPFMDYLDVQRATLESRRQEWLVRLAAQEAIQARLQALTDESATKGPVAFLAYLGTIIPTEIVLTRIALERVDGAWMVQLEGQTSRALSGSVSVLQTLERKLQNGPFRIDIRQSWRQSWLGQLRQGGARSDRASQAGRFLITGTIS